MFFEKRVDTRSRKAMTDFLSWHYRYDTMSSHNHSTSYANCVKLSNLGLAHAQREKAYELLETDFWDEIDHPITDFTSEMGGYYTIGSNGRSGGYLVLMDSCYESTEYKSHCLNCGQRNYGNVSESSNKCGRCGAEGEYGRVDYTTSPKRLAVYPGRSIDQEEEFHPDEWSMGDLRNRVKLVQAFDRACDHIRDNFIAILDSCDVVEETIMIPKTRKVLHSNTGVA